MPVKALTDTLSKHFPQFKFAEGKGAEVKKVIDNSKVLAQCTCCTTYLRDSMLQVLLCFAHLFTY